MRCSRQHVGRDGRSRLHSNVKWELGARGQGLSFETVQPLDAPLCDRAKKFLVSGKFEGACVEDLLNRFAGATTIELFAIG